MTRTRYMADALATTNAHSSAQGRHRRPDLSRSAANLRVPPASRLWRVHGSRQPLAWAQFHRHHRTLLCFSPDRRPSPRGREGARKRGSDRRQTREIEGFGGQMGGQRPMMGTRSTSKKPYRISVCAVTNSAGLTGLQIRVPRFNSGRGLHYLSEKPRRFYSRRSAEAEESALAGLRLGIPSSTLVPRAPLQL